MGIPTGDSMGQAVWASEDVFRRTYNPGIESPKIDEYEHMMMDEASPFWRPVLHLPAHSLKPRLPHRGVLASVDRSGAHRPHCRRRQERHDGHPPGPAAGT